MISRFFFHNQDHTSCSTCLSKQISGFIQRVLHSAVYNYGSKIFPAEHLSQFAIALHVIFIACIYTFFSQSI